MRWMKLEPIIQSEVSQKEKHQYSILTLHIYKYVKWSCSVVSNSLRPHGLQPVRLLCPWGFSRQEYWSGLPFPSPGHLPKPGIKPTSPAMAGRFFTTKPPRRPKKLYSNKIFFLKNKEIICVPQEKPIVLAFIFKIISLVGFLVGVVSEERDKSRYKQVLYGRSDFLENNNVLKL